MRTAAKWLLCMALFAPNLSQAQSYSSREMTFAILEQNRQRLDQEAAAALFLGVRQNAEPDYISQQIATIYQKKGIAGIGTIENFYIPIRAFVGLFRNKGDPQSISIQWIIESDLEYKKTRRSFEELAMEKSKKFDVLLTEALFFEVREYMSDLLAVEILVKRISEYEDIGNIQRDTLMNLTQALDSVTERIVGRIEKISKASKYPEIMTQARDALYETLNINLSNEQGVSGKRRDIILSRIKDQLNRVRLENLAQIHKREYEEKRAMTCNNFFG